MNNISLLGHMKNSKRFISISTRPATTKFGRVVTYVEGLSLTRLHVPLIMSRNKIKTLYLHFHKTYIYQASYSGDFRS